MENCDFFILEEILSPAPSSLVSFEDPSILSRYKIRALGVILGAYPTDSGQRERGDIGGILGQSVLCAMCEHFREAREQDLKRLGFKSWKGGRSMGEFLEEMLSGPVVWEKIEASEET